MPLSSRSVPRRSAHTAYLTIFDFVRESEHIEGIVRDPPPAVLDAHRMLFGRATIGIEHVEEFVGIIQPGAKLRRDKGMNVRVGFHIPPPGGPAIAVELGELLAHMQESRLSPYDAHRRYETLHPFMDGNGRSGRALWAWQMGHEGRDPFALPFLHRWYYDSLDGNR